MEIEQIQQLNRYE